MMNATSFYETKNLYEIKRLTRRILLLLQDVLDQLTLSETGSGTYIVKQGGANLPRMTFGFENYQNCPQMYIKWLLNEYLAL